MVRIAALALALTALLALPASATPAAHDEPVPVLEYHVIGYAQAGTPLEGLYVTPAEFSAQVAWLARNHWHVVTVDRILNHWLAGAPLPSRPVALTFDDGYPGDWRYALPILRRYHWAGNLNLQIGNLVPKRVEQLIHAGWEIDVHTFTHPDLTTVSSAQLYREVVSARFWIQRVLHVHADVFCYPAGRYDATVIHDVRLAGYRAAETENPGWASPRQGLDTLDRIRVEGTTALGDYLR